MVKFFFRFIKLAIIGRGEGAGRLRKFLTLGKANPKKKRYHATGETLEKSETIGFGWWRTRPHAHT